MVDDGQRHFLNRVSAALGRQTGQRPIFDDVFAPTVTPEDKKVLARIDRRTAAGHRKLCGQLDQQARLLNAQVRMEKDPAAVTKAVVALATDIEPEFGSEKRVAMWRHPLIDAMQLTEALAPHRIRVDTPARRPDVKDRVAKACMGVTSADYCVADSATLVLKTRSDQARSVSLLPTVHVAVIEMNQILADLKELYVMLQKDLQKGDGLTNCLTMITGPSKTADIEATLVHGVHGPKNLHIFVITG